MSQGEPRVLGRYAITGEVGRGTMGVVYRAFDPVLGRTVALKTVNVRLGPGDEDRASFETRFMTEARAAALLSHPAIVTVHDLGRDAATDTLYIALEHLEGRTLAEIVSADGALPWRRALAIAGRIAGALGHAHERGIIHRDVKPANIMVLPGDEPKLMDFGIAKIDAADLTAPGDFLGTPSYMSPEQASGTPLDGRSDLFSLGAVLYLALTGRRAFDASSVPGVIARVVNDAYAPLDVPGLPADVEYIVARSLAKSPDQRYARAREMEEDIEDVLAARPPRHRPGWAPSVPAPAAPPVPPPSRGWVDRRRGLSAVAAALVLICVAAAVLRRPAPTPAATAPVAAPVPVPARLEVTFRHPFRVGTLRVWVDDALALEETVPGEVTRDLVAVKLRRGTFQSVLVVPPGERVVRVQVDDGDGFRETRRIRGMFESGEVRRLDIAVAGLLRKDLALIWGS